MTKYSFTPSSGEPGHDNKAYVDDHDAARYVKTDVTNGVIEKNGALETNGYVEKNGYPEKNGFPQKNGAAAYKNKRPSRARGESVRLDEENWGVVELEDTTTPWSELDTQGRILRVLSYFGRFILVLGLIYFFICSIGVLSAAFQLIGGRAAGSIFANNEILSNPICGLMIGVLVTVLVQSSSTSTSIIVTMVAAGILDVPTAIPIVMGANIGTSVTNTIVAVGQANDRDMFRRAFAGATVHDMFNWATVIILLPLDILVDSITGTGGYLYHLSKAIVDAIPLPEDESEEVEFLDAITKPLTNLIVQVDKDVIEYIAQESEREKRPMLKYWCDENDALYTNFSASGPVNPDFIQSIRDDPFTYDLNITNTTEGGEIFSYMDVNESASTMCDYIFVGEGMPGSTLSEEVVGIILLIASLAVLCTCLVILVKTLSSLMKGSVAKVIMKVINWEFKSEFLQKIGLTGYLALIVGAGMTVLVQSSSVFTSTMTPLVGLGVITVERMYPLTLGSNIGTTITSLLAALSSSSNIEFTLQVAFVHLFFNISGILLFYPLPFMRQIPIRLAKKLGHITADYRWFAAVYLILVFFTIPGLIFALSVPGWEVLAGVGIPIVVLIIIIIVINVLQNKKPGALPAGLRDWEWLPLALHSLEPWDRVLNKCGEKCSCCSCCGGSSSNGDRDDKSDLSISIEVPTTKTNGHSNGISTISDNRL